MGKKSIKELLGYNVRDIELIFGAENLAEVLKILRENEKVKQMYAIRKSLAELNIKKNQLLENLGRVETDLNNTFITDDMDIAGG